MGKGILHAVLVFGGHKAVSSKDCSELYGAAQHRVVLKMEGAWKVIVQFFWMKQK